MKNVVLCGFMGSGKSYVGAALARLSHAQFVDMDRAIEEKEGRTVAQIFARDGEAAFGGMECETARALAARPGLVIATGGGTVLRAENVAAFRAAGAERSARRPPASQARTALRPPGSRSKRGWGCRRGPARTCGSPIRSVRL